MFLQSQSALQEDVTSAFAKVAYNSCGKTLPDVETLLRSLVNTCATAVAAALEEGGLRLQDEAGNGGLARHAINAIAGAIKARLASFQVSHGSHG